MQMKSKLKIAVGRLEIRSVIHPTNRTIYLIFFVPVHAYEDKANLAVVCQSVIMLDV